MLTLARALSVRRAIYPQDRLFQCAQCRAEVEMKGPAVEHQSRDGLHAGPFGLRDSCLCGAEMDNFEVDLGGVEIAGDSRLGVETDGAAGVIEGSDGFAHIVFGSRLRGTLRVAAGRGEYRFREPPPRSHEMGGRYHLVPAGRTGAGLHTRRGMKAKHLSLAERNVYRSVEDVVGCKWSAAVVAALQRGVVRPGQLERYIPGISTKILNERLRKLVAYGLATRADHSAVSLHVEYRLTPTGAKLAGVIEQLHDLQKEHDAAQS